jgi:hypothetical protein
LPKLPKSPELPKLKTHTNTNTQHLETQRNRGSGKARTLSRPDEAQGRWISPALGQTQAGLPNVFK